MVDEGVRDTEEMRRHIKSSVPNISDLPENTSNRRFNPTTKTIKNHMYLATKREMCNISDQDNLQDFVSNLFYYNIIPLAREILILKNKKIHY